jgi:small GTP-binding protein
LDDYDYLFKCVVVGDGGCGKTAIVVRFSQGFFQEQYKLTIGVEFAVKTIDVKGYRVKTQIWDTGGQERFQYVRPLYYKGSMGALLVFDLTNRESFDHIAKWIEEVRSNAGKIPMIIVGNKSDLVNERKISREEATQFAKSLDLFYVESSAKSGEGIGDVFAVLALLMIGEKIPPDLLTGKIDIESVISKPKTFSENAVLAKSEPGPSSAQIAKGPGFNPKPTSSPGLIPAFNPKPAPAPGISQSFIPKPAPAPGISQTFTPKPAPAPEPIPSFIPKPTLAPGVSPSYTPKSEPSIESSINFAPKPIPGPGTSPTSPLKPIISLPSSEQKASLTGKPIEMNKGEPEWYAPTVPEKSSIISGTSNISNESTSDSAIFEGDKVPKIDNVQDSTPQMTSSSLKSMESLFGLSTQKLKDDEIAPPVPQKPINKLSTAQSTAENPFLSSAGPTPSPIIPPFSKEQAPSFTSSQENKSTPTPPSATGPNPFLSPITKVNLSPIPPSPTSSNSMKDTYSPKPSIVSESPISKPEEGQQGKFNSLLQALKGKSQEPSSSVVPFLPTSQPVEEQQSPVKIITPAGSPIHGSETITCPKCKAAVVRTFKFCNKCGHRLS